MAWIYQRKDSGLWWMGTRANGRQILKSTGETEKKKALEKLHTLEAMEAAQKAGRLNRELFEELTGARIEPVALFTALDTWVSEQNKVGTKNNYSNLATQLKKAIPHNPPLSEIRSEEIRSFLTDVRRRVAPSTTNLYLKCLKAFFSRFAGSVRKNPTEGIKRYSDDETGVTKKAFTPDQIRSIMRVAPPFWRCATAVAFCTGLRLSNVASLKVKSINFTTGRLEIARTKKTNAKVEVKLPDPVLKLLRGAIPSGAKPDDYIWPDQASVKDVSVLSDQFGEVLIQAGIRKEHGGSGNGVRGRRTVHELTFHSLRHAIVTALANSGVNQQTVKQLVGHASDRVNDAYTHIGQETIDQAAALLPDITV